MANSPIHLDCSPTGIVVACTEHTWWRAFRFHKEDAWDSACAHEEREHGDDRRQRNAREQRRYAARKAAAREADVSGTSAIVRMV